MISDNTINFFIMTPLLDEELRSIVCLATDENRRFTEASVAIMGPDSYLMACSAFGNSAADNAGAMIWWYQSTDGGQTWERTPLVMQNEGGLNVMAPSLIKLSDGSLGLAYLSKQSLRHGQISWRRSFDGGKVWSERVVAYDDGSYTICLNDCLIQTESGRIIFPVFSTREAWVKGEHFQAFSLYSDDFGQTWHRSANNVDCPGRGAMEPVVFDAGNRKVVMLIRTDQGQFWQAESEDDGQTWGEARPTTLEGPQAPCMVKLHPESGILFLIRNPVYRAGESAGGPRIPLTVAISRDRGQTWQDGVYVLEDSTMRTFCYPSITFDDKFLIATYYMGRSGAILCDSPDLRISLCLRKIPLLKLGVS